MQNIDLLSYNFLLQSVSKKTFFTRFDLQNCTVYNTQNAVVWIVGLTRYLPPMGTLFLIQLCNVETDLLHLIFTQVQSMVASYSPLFQQNQEVRHHRPLLYNLLDLISCRFENLEYFFYYTPSPCVPCVCVYVNNAFFHHSFLSNYLITMA